MNKSFKALVVRKNGLNLTRSIEKRSISDLPKGDVLIRVHFTSINYKDVLSSSGDMTVTRHYPHTPGIDAAGIVESSSDNRFYSGDKVVVISFDLGANTSGGFGQFISVPGDWVMPLPKGLNLRESMIYGTAGYTAGLAISILQKQDINPINGPIIVTGASGGVGSISIAILSALGFSVIASSGNGDAESYLTKLGASEVIGRDEVNDNSGRTLLKELWAGAIDTVGGNSLVTIIKSTKLRGAVVSVGLVSSSSLNTSVFPFILRGISLHGTGASETLMTKREKIWSKLANEWKPKNLENIANNASLIELNSSLDKIIIGNEIGRIVVDMR
jgi:acrylyl-CoA reductase (NADPH)